MNVTYFLFTIYLVLNSISCYKRRTLEDDSFCSPFVKRKTYLSDVGDEGLIVTSNRLREHLADWVSDHICKFQIRIDRDYRDILTPFQKSVNLGVIGVIQTLSLRQNKTTGECIDWIQFGYKKNFSKRYCGEISLDNDNGNMIYFPMDFNTDKIDTSVFINHKHLEPHEDFDLSIVYTPAKSCKKAYYPYFKCSKDVDTKALCIRYEFKNDSYLNCPNCLDESDSCDGKFVKQSSGVGTIATVGAILSLIISFIFFLTCVWICKRFHLLCWSHTFAASSNRSTQHSTVEMNLQGNTMTPPTHITSTAPSAPPLSADKDLPPPYESLFPDRAGDR